jgi:hypothetical protein
MSDETTDISVEEIDISTLVNHLEQLVPALMDVKSGEVRPLVLASSDAMDRLKKFALDPQVSVVYIVQLNNDMKKDGNIRDVLRSY